MVLKENWSSGDQLTAAQLNELTAAVKARYTKPGAGIPTSDLNAGQLEAKVKEVGDANYAPMPSAVQNPLTGWWHADGAGARGDGATNDRAAIQSAIDAASAAGGGVVYLKPTAASYLLGSALVPKSGVTVRSDGATITTNFNDSAFWGSTIAFDGFTLDGLDFAGGVTNSPTVPTRGRTTGTGMTSAIGLAGNLDPSVSGGATLTNFTMRNCVVRNCSGLPILIKGVGGAVKVHDNTFINNKDVGFTHCASVMFSGNYVYGSADNGVSMSRVSVKMTCTGNTFENCAYNGIWAAGYLTEPGPTNFAITGNVIKNVGLAGIWLDMAPKYGTVIGNSIDCGYFRGAADEPSDSACVGIFIGSLPNSNYAAPTDYALELVIANNEIRRAANCGILVGGGLRRSIILGNLIADTGTQYLADGTTAISSTDQARNIGILINNPSTCADNTVGLNRVTDSRGTPYTNYGMRPVTATGLTTHLNEMSGCRNAYDLIDNGQARNVYYTPVFNANTKHVSGATAGSTAGTGLIAGFDTNGASGSTRVLRMLTAGAERWRVGADGTAESGSNVGSDLVFASYDDTATAIATILRLTRLGAVTLGRQGYPITTTGRIVSGTAASTVAAGAAATTAAAASNGANATSGTVNATALASPVAGALASVTFATAYTAIPHVVITAANAASAAAGLYLSSRSATGFTVSCLNAPTASASLQFDYIVIG